MSAAGIDLDAITQGLAQEVQILRSQDEIVRIGDSGYPRIVAKQALQSSQTRSFDQGFTIELTGSGLPIGQLHLVEITLE